MNILRRFAFSFAFVYFVSSAAICPLCYGASTEPRAKEVSKSSVTNTLDAQQASPDFRNSSINNLSSEAKEIADLAGVTPILKQIENEQKNEQKNGQIQKLIYLRGKLNAFIQAINSQISFTHSHIESATAQADELRAYITERRNRIARRNTQINLISGGVTKMSGYSLALSPITSIPTNVLEVFDGAVQSTLSALTLREQQKEKKLEHGMPPILESLLTNKEVSSQYAPGIWMYLNHIPPNSSLNRTRREQLIDNWQRTGILPNQNHPQSKPKQPISVDILDQRLAMLSDLKSQISEMNNGLMELSNAIALSYNNDPASVSESSK